MSETTTKRETLVRKAYGEAMSSLRDAHRDEFDTLLKKSYSKYGITVRKRMSAEEAREARAAREQIRAERAEQRRLSKIAALQAKIEELESALDDEVAYSA